MKGAAAAARQTARAMRLAARAHGAPKALSNAEFRRIADLVERLAGIVVPDHKKPLVEGRLGKRLRQLGLPDYASYLDLVSGPDAASEASELVNAMTTNLTGFFREERHFADLAKLLANRPAGARTRIWSAACSTGEEPYSIAVTAIDCGAAAPPADLRILATDIDTRALATARAGVYDAAKIADCPPTARRHFGRAPDGGLRVSDQARGLITFNRLNLHDDWPVRGPFDAIFCRNVLIYFGAESKALIVARFADLLSPGGTLYLGHSEAMLGSHPALRSVGHTIFRKVD